MKKDQFLIDRVAEGARQGRISRRDFMHYSLAAGLTASAATGLWTNSAMAQPKSGGTFRVGMHDNNSSDTHDPGTYLSIQQILLVHTHRSFLTLINTDQTLGGDLASDWSGSDDATEWTFTIRQGVKFHSGRDMTLDDIIASMNHHRGEASTSAAKALLADVTSIDKVGNDQIKFTLAGPNADLPWLMTDYHLAICPGNDDGSIDIYMGPEAPAGYESNFIRTIPGKGFFFLFRLYSPTQAYFDQSWKLNDVERLATTD